MRGLQEESVGWRADAFSMRPGSAPRPLYLGRRSLWHDVEVKLLRLVVIVKNAAVGERQVGDEMMRADHPAHREVRDRCIDMRYEVQPAGAEPGAFDDNVGEMPTS